MKKLLLASLASVAFIGSISDAHAQSNPFAELPSAFKDGKFWLEGRYRYEMVDQSGFANDAKASTVRTNLGYETGDIMNGIKFGAEVQDVSYLSDGEDFNNGINGRTAFPTIADPDGTEVNQVYGKIGFFPGTELKIGRQVIKLDNEKFISESNSRQNNQTFDAAVLKNTSISGVEILYGYIQDVNRVLGNDNPAGHWESDSHIINIGIDTLKKQIGTIGAYAYLLDFENDSPANSSKTFGAFLKGDKNINGFKVNYKAEYAMQSDYADNTNSYDADYYSLSLGTELEGIGLAVNYSVKESEGAAGRKFRTPLGTAHGFYGWSDTVTSPTNGVEDLNFLASYNTGNRGDAFENIKLVAKYHALSAENGSADYGDEIDLLARKVFSKNYYAELKYADFSADSASGLSDVEKIWLTLGFKFTNK